MSTDNVDSSPVTNNTCWAADGNAPRLERLTSVVRMKAVPGQCVGRRSPTARTRQVAQAYGFTDLSRVPRPRGWIVVERQRPLLTGARQRLHSIVVAGINQTRIGSRARCTYGPVDGPRRSRPSRKYEMAGTNGAQRLPADRRVVCGPLPRLNAAVVAGGMGRSARGYRREDHRARL